MCSILYFLLNLPILMKYGTQIAVLLCLFQYFIIYTGAKMHDNIGSLPYSKQHYSFVYSTLVHPGISSKYVVATKIAEIEVQTLAGANRIEVEEQ